MNKTTIIILVVVILLIIGGGGYFLLGKSSQNASPLKQVQDKMTQMTTEKKTLADFFSMTGSQKCTFSYKANNSSGMLYIGDGKMRGDFQSTENSKSIASHMINDGTYVYVWTDGQKNGYKMSTEMVKKDAAQVTMGPGTTMPSETQPSAGPVAMNQQADYSCGPWSVDASLFTLPKGINFIDYSSMLQKTQNITIPPQQGMTTEQKQSACSQCNQVPAGAMRNQCLSALKC